jgi:hypothetical protein
VKLSLQVGQKGRKRFTFGIAIKSYFTRGAELYNPEFEADIIATLPRKKLAGALKRLASFPRFVFPLPTRHCLPRMRSAVMVFPLWK